MAKFERKTKMKLTDHKIIWAFNGNIYGTYANTIHV